MKYFMKFNIGAESVCAFSKRGYVIFFNWNYDEKYFVLKNKFYRKNFFINIIFKSILLHIDSLKISKTHTNFYPQKKTFHKQKLQYKQTSSAPLNLDITSPDTIPKRTI